MSLKSILAHVDETPGALIRAELAAKLAARHGGSATALVVSVAPGEPFGPGAEILDGTISAMRAQITARRLEDARSIAARVKTAAGLESDVLQVETDRIIVDVASRMRPADLVVVGPPRENGQMLDEDVLEAALFSSGRPVIVLPHERSGAEVGRTVAIAWKDCREAARAIHEAMPILEAADLVRFVVVHAQEDARYFGAPALARMEAALRARGVKVGDAEIDKQTAHVGEALDRSVGAIGADLLVMGAYGRWRMTERLFGGVTRHVLHESSTPLFLAH
ncbi:MAG: universal stress protein [Hyphomonadaceae bacterium]|nr:universal stress protein [Hyphomonadaceae bacterium]